MTIDNTNSLATQNVTLANMTRKTSVVLSDDLHAAWKAAALPLAEIIRRGLETTATGTAARDGGQWITVQDAASLLGVTASRVHHLLAEGWLYSRKAPDGWHREVYAPSVAAELAARARRPPYPPDPALSLPRGLTAVT